MLWRVLKEFRGKSDKTLPPHPEAFHLHEEIIHHNYGIIQHFLVFLVGQMSVSSSGVIHSLRKRTSSFSSVSPHGV